MRGRGARAVLLLALVAVTTVGVGVAPPVLVAPAAAAGTSVTSAAWGAASVTARGLVPASVTLTVRLASAAAGVEYLAVIEDAADTGRSLAIFLQRASGDLSDGAWTATARFAAVDAGRYRIVSVTAIQGESYDYLTVPAPRPEVEVVGTHVPRLVAGQEPDPVRVDAPVAIVGRLVDSTTGRGFASVWVEHDLYCDPGWCPTTRVRTDARGGFRVPYRLVRVHGVLVPPQRMEHVLQVRAGKQSDGSDVFAVMTRLLLRVRVSVTARAARTALGAGAAMTVVGTVVGSPFGAIRGVSFPSPRCRIVLERLRGATSWRAVAGTLMRSSHRFTVVAPALRGRHAYRVRALTCGPQQRAVSPRFVVTWV